MKKETEPKNHEAIRQALMLLLLTLISLLAVHFPPSNKGMLLHNPEDFDRLTPQEKRVAQKLLSLGIQPEFETIEILLDQDDAVFIATKSSGEKKFKVRTVPDLNFTLNGIKYYLEIGSGVAHAHKHGQQKVAEKALEVHKGNDFFYAQLFNGDIDQLIDQVETQTELVDFLHGLSDAVYAPPKR